MSLIVQSPNSASSSSTPGATGPGGASAKWMWAAIGALGASVLALGATLIVQQTHRDAVPAQPVAALAAPAAADTRVAQAEAATAQNAPAAQVQRPQAAIHQGATRVRSGSGREDYAQGGYGSPSYSRPVSAQPVARAPVCASCGRVESVQAVQEAAPATGVGAIAGGVLGGVLGNQVGKGNGRTAATLIGALGGGYLGHTVEQRTRTTTAYQIRVRMDDGSIRTFTRSQPVAQGTPVRVDGGSFQVYQGGSDAGYYGNNQPMRVVNNTY
ncbi:glycine zipper 2TM domain-containing protein [Paracidovorax wautersii]|uniref:Outer membrane lipoprotein SlyB n=1 Tax=Paracidovorax wautersii TaxID=1177982 RepID=A0A1I2AVM0_9BURK|nr:glycine zipper 2TM domain-containing protein [Paracidovorax wautersii]SFE47658.1 Outer membrane lipoprotein SlyB [Paracidovorax wautersii]